MIGLLFIRYTDVPRQQAHLDLILRTDQQRQGFGTEAMVAALSFCFAGIGLHRVTANCDPRNLGAVKLLEKVGLHREGVARQCQLVQDDWADLAYYAGLQDELAPLQRAEPED